jgi:hypothetical protein
MPNTFCPKTSSDSLPADDRDDALVADVNAR